ncbi:uncharacterized protein LOC132721117 [Ruditapes philippinarum]|uniref:uncharacterized protein LOC132721117 n=1 Tax=Ruditapes philippinarum TaxID=129788 RepID=UPI00295B63B6|nr:uncharacterized protein LOC132721117 [Ruditapes philippinarum]
MPNDVHNDNTFCPVCLESGTQPKFLPCTITHMICEPCLQNLIKCSDGRTFKCPICRKEYTVDTFAPVQSRQYGEQNNHYVETSFSSQGNFTTISERVQNEGDRRLADRMIRSHSDSRINERPETYSNNRSGCGWGCCCQWCIIAVASAVCILHLCFVAIYRFISGTYVTWSGDYHGTIIAWYTVMDWFVIFCIILYKSVYFFIKQN